MSMCSVGHEVWFYGTDHDTELNKMTLWKLYTVFGMKFQGFHPGGGRIVRVFSCTHVQQSAACILYRPDIGYG